MRNKKLLVLCVVISMMSFNSRVFSKTLTIKDINNITFDNSADKPSTASNSWEYKSLVDISKKYGIEISELNTKTQNNSPLSRNDAALILVNLISKIEQNNLKIEASEQYLLEALKQDYKQELNQIVSRVANVETSVNKLQGSVSKLEGSNNQTWKSDFGEKFKINGNFKFLYSGNTNKGSDSTPANFSIPLSDITFSGKLKSHLNYCMSLTGDLKINPDVNSSVLRDAYVSSDIIPHHNIFVGQMRTPIGYEGTKSPIDLDFAYRSQIARNFSDRRDQGLKIVGNYKLVDYTLGVFDGNGINQNETKNSALDTGVWVVIKPLAYYPQYGSLKLGGGYYNGRFTNLKDLKQYNHNNYGYFANYNYNKFNLTFEQAYKEGFTLKKDDIDVTRAKANGWYLTPSYMLTKKIQLLTRYDRFDPSQNVSNNSISEYTAGANYFMANNNLKFQFDYVFVDNNIQTARNSQRVMVLSQYTF